jgi:NAD(P)-dependent dehydrogenase (short-subunit alcohol dehydrogenase family)
MNTRRHGPDTRALVVTGASRGIGAQIARQAAAAGTPVALLYHSRPEAAAAVVDEISGAGGAAIAIGADIGNEHDVIHAFKMIDGELGDIGALVNNAVAPGKPARVEDLRIDQVELVFRTNVFGALLCSREATKRLSTRRGNRGGAIVTLSSANAVRSGGPGAWVPFAASKRALETMSLGLAKELADEGIRSNVVRVGVIGTETRIESPWHQERIGEALAPVPMARMGETTEVAAAVLWLLSPESSYVTGAVVDVAGGL